MKDEGYIKFQCIWDDSPIVIPEAVLIKLESWRRKLYDLSLIGVLVDGVGYGNISIRNDDGTFYITGSATGIKPSLNQEDYGIVTKWQFEKNELHCSGKTKASSESLTHAAIYESNEDIRSVVHVHNLKMWNEYLTKVPATRSDVSFGTPGMAMELKRLLKDGKTVKKGIVIMAGHKEGILTFGKNLDEAGEKILEYYYQSLNNSTISTSGSK